MIHFARLYNYRDAWFVRHLSRKAIHGTATNKPITASPDQKEATEESTAQPAQNHEANQPETKDGSNDSHPQDYSGSASQDTKKDDAKNEVEKAEQTNEELFRVRASRWVDFFPNELIINEKNITVIKRDLFVSRTETWSIEDLGEVTLIDAPVFGGLRLVGKIAAHKLNLKGIPREKAIKAKELIDGLVLENQQQVKLPQRTSTSEHRKMLREAGQLPEGTGPTPTS